MKKAVSYKLKESSADELKALADYYSISQADVLEKLIDFLWITTDDLKHNRGTDIDTITNNANVRNLIQSLR